MNRFTTAAIFLLILAASVFAAGGALKPVTATEKGIETRPRPSRRGGRKKNEGG